MSKNLFVGNESMWMKLAESENDYAIFFIKNWIPFNAWFYNTYKLDNDRKHIEAIKNNVNPIKDKIVALLHSPTSEGISFRSNLALLHEALENNSIRTNGERICFSDIYFRKNTNNTKNVNYQDVRYFVDYVQVSKTYRVIVEKPKNKVKKTLYINQSIKDIEALKTDIQGSSLDRQQQQFLIQCFREALPEKKENLLTSNKKQALKVGSNYFINDDEAIAQALIEILYNLRCVLFHGEIIPNAQNLAVYEHAYHVLRVLVKTLNK